VIFGPPQCGHFGSSVASSSDVASPIESIAKSCMEPKLWRTLASRRNWIPVLAVAAVLFYVGVYLWGAHSEGFRFMSEEIRQSPVIQQRVGDVQSVRLSFLGGYREKFVGDHIRTTMMLDVRGSKGSASVEASAKKVNGTWAISDASIDGDRVRLDRN